MSTSRLAGRPASLLFIAVVAACRAGPPEVPRGTPVDRGPIDSRTATEPTELDSRAPGSGLPVNVVDLADAVDAPVVELPSPPTSEAPVGVEPDLWERAAWGAGGPFAIRSRGSASDVVPWVVFGLPLYGSGALAFVDGDGVRTELLRPPSWADGVQRFGRVIEPYGELDDDPVAELLVSAYGEADPGRVFVVSPVSRRVLRVIPAPPGVAQFGRATCSVQDFDRDGLQDVAVLGVHAEGSEHAGRLVVSVCSTGTGKVLHTPLPASETLAMREGAEALRWLPLDLHSGGGLLLVLLSEGEPGTLRALDVTSAREAWRLDPGTKGGFGPRSIALLDQDLDGDGVDEVVVGEIDRARSEAAARVRVLSGRTGRERNRIVGLGGSGEHGPSLAVWPDEDGDGVDELLVGDIGASDARDTLWMLSGDDGRPLRRLAFADRRWRIGHPIQVTLDVDRRGDRELLLGVNASAESGDITETFGVLSLEGPRWLAHADADAVVRVLDEDSRALARAEASHRSSEGSESGTAAAAIDPAEGERSPDRYAVVTKDHRTASRHVRLAESASRGMYGVELDSNAVPHGLGSSFTPIARGADFDGEAPLVAFGLPYDGDGSLWFLKHGGVDPECLLPDPSFGAVSQFARCIESIPDVDGDGVSDLVVAAPGRGEEGDEGVLFVVSSLERDVLYAVRGPEGEVRFGTSLCVLPDLDGDGIAEIAVVGVAERVGRYGGRGALHIVSPGSERILATPAGGFDLSPFGEFPITHLPATGSPAPAAPDVAGERAGAIVLRDGRDGSNTLVAVEALTGAIRWRVPLSPTGSVVGLCAGSDVDEDGVQDVVVLDYQRGEVDTTAGSGGAVQLLGRTRVLSGRTGVLLHGTRGLETGYDALGVTAGPDLDGDGLREIVVTEPGFFGGGRLLALSGRDGRVVIAVDQSGRFWRVERAAVFGSDWDGGGLPDYVVASSVPTAGSQPGAHAIGVVSLETDLMFHYVTPSVMQHWIDRRDGGR